MTEHLRRISVIKIRPAQSGVARQTKYIKSKPTPSAPPKYIESLVDILRPGIYRHISSHVQDPACDSKVAGRRRLDTDTPAAIRPASVQFNRLGDHAWCNIIPGEFAPIPFRAKKSKEVTKAASD